MTGPLVGVTVLQPLGGTVVLPGQSVTCSGRATGHGGVQTTLVDRVVLNLDRGADIEADLSPVVPKPAVPAVNWAASVAAPGQPGPHDLTITAFPDDGGAVASVTVGFTVQEPAISLTGVWECDDGGLYYLRQGPDRSVIWAGLHDSGFHKGLDFTNVFHGWLSADGGALAGDWADVPRGATANSGTLAAGIWETGTGDLFGSWTTGSTNNGGGAFQNGWPTANTSNQVGLYTGPWDAFAISQVDFYSWVGAPKATEPTNLNAITYLDNDNTGQNQSGAWAFHGVTGEGMLYCDGDLTLNSTFVYKGLVYIEGDLKLNGQAWILEEAGRCRRGRAPISFSCTTLQHCHRFTLTNHRE